MFGFSSAQYEHHICMLFKFKFHLITMEKDPVIAKRPICARAALPATESTKGTANNVIPPGREIGDAQAHSVLKNDL